MPGWCQGRVRGCPGSDLDPPGDKQPGQVGSVRWWGEGIPVPGTGLPTQGVAETPA